MALPVLEVSGTTRAQGLAHGEELRDRVRCNVDLYFERFLTEGRVSRDTVVRHARAWGEAIRQRVPGYHEGMRGIAEGAGVAPDDIVAVNVRYEILYYLFGVNAIADEAARTAAGGERLGHPEPDGCTAFAVLPDRSANGHLFLGQNWDWIPACQGAVVRTREDSGLSTLAFTEAGIFGGKIGLNSEGLGLCINGMTTTEDDWSSLRTPMHVRTWGILRSRSLDAAAAVVTDEPRACAGNLLLAQAPDRALDLEAAPGVIARFACGSGCFVHTNHFTDPDALGVVEPPSERRPHSYNRLNRMQALLASKPKVAGSDIKVWVTDHEDHPFGICRHEDWEEPPSEHYVTVTSVLMDLNDRTMTLTDGQPCRGDWQDVSL